MMVFKKASKLRHLLDDSYLSSLSFLFVIQRLFITKQQEELGISESKSLLRKYKMKSKIRKKEA